MGSIASLASETLGPLLTTFNCISTAADAYQLYSDYQLSGEINPIDAGQVIFDLATLGTFSKLRLARSITGAAERLIEGTFDFVRRGALGGKVADALRLSNAREALGQFGFQLTTVARDDASLIPSWAGAAFDQFGKQIIVRANATTYELMHEMFHYKQWKEVGEEGYAALTRLEKEQYVYDQLVANAEKLKLNEAELQHALDYINDIKSQILADAGDE